MREIYALRKVLICGGIEFTHPTRRKRAWSVSIV
jgi:hypothetical protein